MNTIERKKEVVAATFQLIAQLGMQDLTVKKIAQAVGVSEPAIYRHFGSKAEILSAVVDEMVSARHASFTKTKAMEKDAQAMLSFFFIEQALRFESFPSLTIILFPEDLFKNDQELQERVTGMMDETRAFIRDVLGIGMAQGSLRSDLDPEDVAFMLVGGFRLLVSSWRLASRPFSLPERTRQFLESALPLIGRHRPDNAQGGVS